MKRSQINEIYREARRCFESHGWALPPHPQWDITDFGLNQFEQFGLVAINLADEDEYCEKLMFARENQITPLHSHVKKKEDIICRHGNMAFELWQDHPETTERGSAFFVHINNELRQVNSGETIILTAGERITLVPGIYHAFWPTTCDCIVGEVSTGNDDTNDNFFVDKNIGRYPEIEEDEPALVRLISELTA